MTNPSDAARRHYEAGLLDDDPAARILAELEQGTLDIAAIDLEALDQFHAGGVMATLQLGGLLQAPSGGSVLDAGSGLGGPARVLAERFGYHVTGVDLTPGYVELAHRLAELTGSGDRVDYQVADLLALPFADGTFDGAYSQHVAMNVEDRAAMYRELRRVLKTGAGFAFHDVIAADGADRPIYPTPWAQSAATSFLLDEDDTLSVLGRAGLRVDALENVSNEAVSAIARLRGAAPAGPTLGSIMGPRFAEMAANYGRNLKEGRLRVVMGRATAV